MFLSAYWWTHRRNFGDQLAEYLVRQVSGHVPINSEVPPRLLSLGSIFSFACPGDIIWGSGIREAERTLDSPLDVRAIRGPLTLRQLRKQMPIGDVAFGDPALLLTKYYHPTVSRAQGVTVIPHFLDDELGGGDRTLSVDGDPFLLIDAIVSSDMIVTSSLHALIIAEIFETPVVLVRNPGHLRREPHFKYLDYFASTGRGDCSVFHEPVHVAVQQVGRIPKPQFPDRKKLLDAFPWDALPRLSWNSREVAP